MRPWVDGDEALNKFVFDRAFISLHLEFSLSLEDAEALIRGYLDRFTSAEFCKAACIPVQDAEFFFHEGVGMAKLMYYCFVVKADPSDYEPHEYIEWRARQNARRRESSQVFSRAKIDEELKELARRQLAAETYLLRRSPSTWKARLET
jgi:hypothetical protein